MVAVTGITNREDVSKGAKERKKEINPDSEVEMPAPAGAIRK
jgi:hypothetical protein